MRTLFHKPNRIGELRVKDADIEVEPVARKCFNTTYKVGLNAKIHAFGLDETADTFDEWVLCQFFNEGCHLCSLFEGCPCNNALNPRLYCCCEVGNPGSLFQAIIGMRIALTMRWLDPPSGSRPSQTPDLPECPS